MSAARGTALRPYAAVVGARFRTLLQYRAAAIAGLWTQIIFGMVLIMIYEGFYRSSTAAVQPMSFAQVASYVWLGQALFAMLPWSLDAAIADMVRDGAIAYELCRPVDLYNLWYARSIAQRTAPTLLRSVPMALFASLGLPLIGLAEWRLGPPASLAAAAGFVASLGCALALSCAVSTILNICVLRTIRNDGILILITAAMQLFSGILIPLPMLPAWAQTAVRWNPFAGMIDLPFRIYSGHIAMDGLALVLARQIGWTIALVTFGRWLLGRTMRRVVVQGG